MVIEAAALPGLSTVQIADYAAMRLLTNADPARLPSGAPSTILSAVEADDEAEVPVTLTAWDLGLLRGLYRSGANLYAPAQRGMVASEILRSLQGANERSN
jgi:hypothetical protein